MVSHDNFFTYVEYNMTFVKQIKWTPIGTYYIQTERKLSTTERNLVTGGHTCIQQKPVLGKLGSKVQIHRDWKVQTLTSFVQRCLWISKVNLHDFVTTVVIIILHIQQGCDHVDDHGRMGFFWGKCYLSCCWHGLITLCLLQRFCFVYKFHNAALLIRSFGTVHFCSSNS